jgi:hypothetical protein
MSEIRVTRDGNYSSSNSRAPDPILLPVGLADGEKEAIGDSLHLLSTFAVIHNKGSVSSFILCVCVCRRVAIKKRELSLLRKTTAHDRMHRFFKSNFYDDRRYILGICHAQFPALLLSSHAIP